MIRKANVSLIVLILLAFTSLPALAQKLHEKSLRQIHSEAIIVDTHVDTVLRMLDKGVQLGQWSRGHIDIPKMQRGGLDVVFFSIFVDPAYRHRSKIRAEQLIQIVKQQVNANPESIEMAYSYNDIIRIVKKGKIAALLGLEGGHPLLDNLDNLDNFYRQGIRYMGLTWSKHLNWADSSGPASPRFNGLTDFGKSVIKRMNKLGMLIDISHSSDSTFWDVFKLSKAPFIASHSSVRSLRQHRRNLNDSMIKNLAKSRGVMGINFYPNFLTVKRKATVKDVVDHIEYAVKIAGPDVIGIGSDYDGIFSVPVGLEDVSKIFIISQELHRRGFKEETIKKILGGNFMRVFKEVLK